MASEATALTVSIVKLDEKNNLYRKKGPASLADEVTKSQFVNHPAIAVFHQNTENGFDFCIATKGRFATLKDALPNLRSKRSDSEQLVMQIAEGLLQMNTRFLIHGFLNLETICVTPKCAKACIMDFRNASFEGQSVADFTANGFFSAPEILGLNVASNKSDVFSLGMLYMCMIQGSSPDTWPGAPDSDKIRMFAATTESTPDWVRLALHCDPRYRPYVGYLIRLINTTGIKTCSGNPFHALVDEALNTDDEGAQLAALDRLVQSPLTEPWRCVMPSLMIFIPSHMFPLRLTEHSNAMLERLMNVLAHACQVPDVFAHVPTTLNMKQVSAFLLTCFAIDGKKAIAIMHACTAANLSITLDSDAVNVLLEGVDSPDDQMIELLAFAALPPNMMARIMHAGIKRHRETADALSKKLKTISEIVGLNSQA